MPDIPTPDALTATERQAQAVLRTLVEESGGRLDSRAQIAVEHLDVLSDLFNEWALRHGTASTDGIRYSGRPGLWHALDELYPLQDPNRWDELRCAVIARLEARNWRRKTPPRGSAFDITKDASAQTARVPTT